MAAEIRYETEFPSEVLPAVKEAIESHRQLIPDWCNWVTVYFSTEDGDRGFDLETVVTYEYRYAQIYVYAGWLTSRDREHEFVHELFHIITGPAHTHAKTELQRQLKDAPPALRDSVLDSFRMSAEATVEDLTILYFAGRLAV